MPGNHPFSTHHQDPDTLARCGERHVIERLRSWLAQVSQPSPQGIGDDCAIIDLPQRKRQILTTDAVTWGQHFDERVSAAEAGAKLIKRNLSDIAAMGGDPGPALLTLMSGPDLSLRWLESFIAGVREACLTYGVQIVGGDVSELDAGHFSAGLALTGYVGEHYKLRSTAAVGDHIYVTGQLGGSILGKHYNFEPRLREGSWLASRSDCTAMMDLTDGLAKDLGALLPENSSAAIVPAKLPISAAAAEQSRTTGRTAIEHAFCDGEDYELLFCCSASADTIAFEADWDDAFPKLEIRRIGQITTPGGSRYLDASTGKPLGYSSGFEHFLPR